MRTFTATAGQKLTLTVTGNTIPAVDLTIRQPNGASFVGSQSVSGPSVFHDVMTLPVTGTYTITIDPRDQDTGTLTFRLDPVPDNIGTTAIGKPTDVTIGTIGENAVRTFAATAGQKITMTVTGNTIPAVDLTIRQPNGAPFVGSQFVSGPTAFHDMMTLPVTGTLHDHDRPARPEHRHADLPARPGARQHRHDGDRHADRRHDRDDRRERRRTFAATAGQKITMTVSGNTIPAVDLTIRQPNGDRSSALSSSPARAPSTT